MQALKRAAPLLCHAAGSAPTTAGLHYPPPGIGPCIAKVCWNHSVAEEEVSLLTIEELDATVRNLKLKNEEAIAGLDRKFQRSLLEQKMCMNSAMLDLKCDVKKDADEKYYKYCLARAEAKNLFKILVEKFESHKLEISHVSTQGAVVKLKNYGWAFGLGTAVLTKFTGIPKFFCKTNGKQ